VLGLPCVSVAVADHMSSNQTISAVGGTVYDRVPPAMEACFLGSGVLERAAALMATLAPYVGEKELGQMAP
jgi:hypothetical protein